MSHNIFGGATSIIYNQQLIVINSMEKLNYANVESTNEMAFMKLFEDGLKDMYWVENALVKAIPKMIEKATSGRLIAALEDHLSVTERQVEHLDRIFASIDKKPRAKKCLAMEGIIKEVEETMRETEGIVRDAGIIYSAQKVEHYEIASYSSLCAFANLLNLRDAAEIFKIVLNEEKEADEELSDIAENVINAEAVIVSV